MFALPISMPCFKSIILYQNRSKIKLFLQKMQSFQTLGAPVLHASGGWGLHPQTPNLAPPLQIPGYTPDCTVCSMFTTNQSCKAPK